MDVVDPSGVHLGFSPFREPAYGIVRQLAASRLLVGSVANVIPFWHRSNRDMIFRSSPIEG
jgi:hypothetical protein